MKYQLAFDINQKGFDWGLPAVGLGLIIFGAVMICLDARYQWPWHKKWAGYVFVALASISTGAVFGGRFAEYYKLHDAYRKGEYATVEGVVENFRPMPREGHRDECFSVKASTFCYSDYGQTAGFNNSASHGGPIRNGLPVRIGYIGDAIVRIEVSQDANVSRALPTPR